jgi:transposase
MSMAKKYRTYQPNQEYLLPPNIHDWLPENHLAYFISETVDNLDLSEIFKYYEQSDRGNPPYHPSMMTKVILYAYCVGTPSSRKIDKALEEDVPFRVLGAGNFPDFRTISEFRRIHLESLSRLFIQVLELCEEAGMVKLGVVALDGTKMKANASMDKNRKHKKLTEEEERLEKIVKEMFEQAENIDDEEDRIYGPTNRGDELPKGFRTRKERLERIRKAKKDLEKTQREKQEIYEKMICERKKKEEETGKKLRGRKPKKIEDINENKAVANTTDPESRIMKTRKSFIQGYNAQAGVDCESQVIVAAAVTQEQNDKHQLVSMLNLIRENMGRNPKNTIEDAGYWNQDQINKVDKEIELFIATDKDWKQREKLRRLPPPRGRIPNNLSLKDRMERKLLTKRGKAIYKMRGCTIEPAFGQIKDSRGLNKFLLRGLNKVNGEWNLICITHNILKLWKKTTAFC